MTRYYTDEEDKAFVKQHHITIRMYLLGTFMADLIEVDETFANSIDLKDLRIELCENAMLESQEWHIWIVDVDEQVAHRIVGLRQEIDPGNNDWVVIREVRS